MNDRSDHAVPPTAPAHAGDGAEVDRQHPWLGLASFTEETRTYFHGREEEVAELARRVQRKLLTILFGQSGLGKTSILRAGLVPKLRPEGYCPVYVRVDYAPESPRPSEQIKQAIFRETQASGTWTQTGVAVEGESLWEFLHHRDDVLRDADGRTLVPLLIFDQFEEVFTIAQGDAFGRERAGEFLADLADLVENRPPKALEARLDEDETAIERFDFTRADYRILIALREDYLAHLESLKAMMPSITQNRMRLARMTGVQALSAVTRPGGRLVSEEVAESIVRFVAGGAELRNAEVEPALLSLVCRELNNARIAKGRSEISADVLAGSRETILAEFYERALAGEPEAVRKVIEDHLLTESGYRESLAEERLQKLLAEAGAAPGTMAKLVDRRLLRVEERLDVRRVELTHDVLTGVVKASRDVRLEREAREAAEAKLAAQRERERATRRALVRARQIAAGAAVLAVVAIGSAIYGYFATERAQAAEARSEEIRLMAEQARGEAEKLVVYLLDDFHLELAPVGRLDIVAALARRAIDYYDGLPAALRTPQSERNRALAQVRYGAVLRTQARLDEGRKAIDEAVATLSRLHEQGDRSEPTAIGLALGLSTRARIVSSTEADSAALPHGAKAVETLQALARAPNASVAMRRAYGDVLTQHGYLQLRNGEPGSIATLDQARAAYRSIADLAMTDPSAAASYAEATAWLVEAYSRQDRMADAIRAADEVRAITARVLGERPSHMQALRAQALASSPLSAGLRLDGRTDEALAMNDRARATWREFVRIDPGNTISWSNLAVSYLIRSDILLDMGRVADAVANYREALVLEREAKPSLMLWSGLANNAGRLALTESMRGHPARASEALATSQRLRAWTITQLPEGSFERKLRSHLDEFWQSSAASASGAHERAIALGQSFTTKVEPLEPAREDERSDWVLWLGFAYENTAASAYALGDYALAERAIARGQELRKTLTGLLAEGEGRRTTMFGEAIRAMVLVRQGKVADAQAAIGPALEYQRAVAARGHTSAEQELQHAVALYVAALVGVGDRAALLSDAAARMDRLPEELRTTIPNAVWRRRIAEEMGRRGAR